MRKIRVETEGDVAIIKCKQLYLIHICSNFLTSTGCKQDDTL